MHRKRQDTGEKNERIKKKEYSRIICRKIKERER
jgi:hypothetical protein